MKTYVPKKVIVISNLLVAIYFSTLYFINYFQIDFVVLGVFRELLTIPFILGSVFLSIVAIVNFITLKNKSALRLISGVVVLVTTFLVFRSIFF